MMTPDVSRATGNFAPAAAKRPARATDSAVPTDRVDLQAWTSTELLVDNDTHFPQRKFHPRAVQRDAEIVKAFGTDQPHSGAVLLHYAGDPPPGVPKQPHPVLLIHGANKTGDFFLDPKEDGSGGGLPERLRGQGFEVFAVTFANNQDDNNLQAEQIANVSRRIRERTGADSIDLLAHSKGGVAARIYCSDSSAKEAWMTPYQNDVHRLVLVAAPNGGLDSSFRHASFNLPLLQETDNPLLNAPTSWSNYKVFGLPVSLEDSGFGSEGADFWPGQRQLLARWDSKYPIAYGEPDSHTTYYGGEGFISSSKGIDYYINQGGNMIDRLDRAAIEPHIEVALLAGDKPDIPGILNENTGPSDGLLFVDSALHMPSTKHIIQTDILPYNHKALVAEAEGQEWIADVLRRP